MKQRSTLAICGMLLLWNYSTVAFAQSEHDFSKWEKAIAAFEQQDGRVAASETRDCFYRLLDDCPLENAAGRFPGM